jgi:hypothetical protein
MSADNWTICPRCLLRAEKAAADKRQEATDAYGKLPVAEWQALYANAEKASERFDKQTLREDYELGTDCLGVFSVEYRAHCGVCQLSYKFTDNRTVEGLSL